MIDPIRGSIWRSNINSFLGTMFLGSVGLFAGILIWQAGVGTNPIAQAFEATVYKSNTYIPSLP